MSGFCSKAILKIADYASSDYFLNPERNEDDVRREDMYLELCDDICSSLDACEWDDASHLSVGGYYPQGVESDCEEVIWGSKTPDALVEYARNMKANARRKALALIKEAAPDTTLENVVQTLEMDSMPSYTMKQAFRMLDNDANSECSDLFYNGCWRCFPDTYELEDIEENPSHYAVVSIFFK